MEYCDLIQRHYEQQWLKKPKHRFWMKGPIDQLPREFCVLELPPNADAQYVDLRHALHVAAR